MARWSAVERTLRAAGAEHICGIDEVGRGPLAGPVFACAIVMPAGRRAIAGVDDSKRVPPAARERLAARIVETAVGMALGAASVTEIDRLNIRVATALAMRRALGRLRRGGVVVDAVLVDGLPVPELGEPHQAVVGGDAKCYAIACASLVAKVARDGLMRRLGGRYPNYNWESNAGYGAPAQLAALSALGLTPHHRRSFCGRWGGWSETGVEG